MDPNRKPVAETLLKHAVGSQHARFREGQWEAIEDLVFRKSRLLVVQRTGWGKSMVYFMATRLLRDSGSGPTLLISPLLALMRNQLAAAVRMGVRAETLNSSNPDEWKRIRHEIQANKVDILLVSPERLANGDFREDVLLPMAERIGMFVVDEAHCISDWGHDFRPDYRRITRVLNALPANIPVLATTATANDRVVRDVMDQLGRDIRLHRGPLTRTSLRLQNIHLPSQAGRMAWLAEHVPRLPGSGIIYVLTIRDAQRLAEWLRSKGIDAHAYWGGLDHQLRLELEDRLLANQVKALVATTALGMGFDKPDLGFVIHFQRPGSVVHYYQQVGRAGRAVDQAFGVLLSGDEDEEITGYFINTAFPPMAHVEEVLKALNEADDGLSTPMLQQRVNLRSGQIEKVIKILAVETPSPVSKIGARWHATPVEYHVDQAKVDGLIAIRHAEQAKMKEYLESRDCLMAFLQRELDDPHETACGRCANCRGEPLLPVTCDRDLAIEALRFLKRTNLTFEPRKLWPAGALKEYGWQGRIAASLLIEEGRVLCLWGDPGWGEMVRRGKGQTGRFDDSLVDGASEMIRDRWQPEPAPIAVVCVPSLNHPGLVPDFARRLAGRLALPFIDCVSKVKETAPQKHMQNSFQQAHNLDGAFHIDESLVPKGPVLLVDDVVDSKWTLTVVGALLRQSGAGPVFPMALAVASPSQ